ncbi:MAG: hypothetical protein AAF694_22760 [Bacteroidota bacterium]
MSNYLPKFSCQEMEALGISDMGTAYTDYLIVNLSGYIVEWL